MDLRIFRIASLFKGFQMVLGTVIGPPAQLANGALVMSGKRPRQWKLIVGSLLMKNVNMQNSNTSIDFVLST